MKNLIFLIIFSSIFAEVKTDDQLWYGIQFDKAINNFEFEISQENRFENNFEKFHKSLTEFSISYKLFNIFKLSTQFRNIQYDDKFKSRIGFSNKMGYSISKFDFGFKSKLQKDYLNNKTPENLVFRNKFSIEYEFSLFLEPYISHEIFHQFIDSNLNFEKYRITSGIKYDISPNTSMKIFYCYNGSFDNEDFELKNIIGINYEFSF